MDGNNPPPVTEGDVLNVLAGTPLHRAAANAAVRPADLATAVKLYKAAGRAALQAHTTPAGWHQVHLEFPDRNTAEHAAATHLGPGLRQAEEQGIVESWWFIRKSPCWRLRCRPGPSATTAALQAALDALLDDMQAQQLITRCRKTHYEPETHAFGGHEGMDIAHNLFHADSRGILDYLRRYDPAAPAEHLINRRELSILLLSTLFRAAGQDWYEQGDIWNLVTTQRPLPPDTPQDRLNDMTPALHHLMTLNPSRLSVISQWTSDFETAGNALMNASVDGRLTRGIRQILAHHVIFHWNRLGLPDRTQRILAQAARDTVMNPSIGPPRHRPLRDA